MNLVMALITTTLFMEMLDGSVILTALPTMARSFHSSTIELNFGVSIYLLALGVFIPISGWAADRFGARVIFTSAIGLFTVSSALCGAADGVLEFVILRGFQGLAGAMMVPVGRLVVMRITPRGQLLRRMSALLWPALSAPLLGPPLGGFITLHWGWRWIFYLNVPIGIVALAVSLILIPDVRGDGPRKFDGLGFFLVGGCTVALLSGLEWMVASDPSIGVALIGVGIVLARASWRHLRRAEQPIVDLSALNAQTYLASIRGGSINRMAIGSVPFLLPLQFQEGFGMNPARSGFLVLFVFLGNLGMKAFTTPLLKRFGFKRILLVNGVLAAASIAGCALLTLHTEEWVIIALLLFGGASRSLQFTTLSTLTVADIPKSMMKDSNSLFHAVLQISSAAGIAFAAFGVRLATLGLGGWDAHAGADAYRAGFILMALVALFGLFDAIRLPSGAGIEFVRQSR
ncbi:MFS transporter [Novosphingobium flavum]|uniref:MFS transporter n=1 Tax=Novosphingobium flavum TaxID=1778672 RepID=A0A7X1FTL3_9SPHN|nr:MFS transporter [Novosphingobium flavum]